MGKVIVGIHGLANKPTRERLKEWWNSALLEGLRNRGVADADFRYEMVYWADLLYKFPLHEESDFSFDALYNSQPYRPADPGALQAYDESWRDTVFAAALDIGGIAVDGLRRHFGVHGLADWFLARVAKDLAFYYDENRRIASRSGEPEVARKVLLDELKNALEAERENEIMLIAHSMGTIVAYDALRDLGRSDTGVEVSHLVTIGSPLGLPHVKGKIVQERTYDPQVRTPSIVTQSWKNFSDRKDPVALDVRLRDDYGANNKGVRVEDDLIQNDYYSVNDKGEKDPNPHKSYGYLRAPEVADHVRAFLGL